ncbi:MAG: hypothetical protein ACE5FI_04580 [Anaerolineales bacterium]
MKTVCLHHNDHDGHCSAAIVRRALGSEVVLHEMTYGEPTPWAVIDTASRVVIVDFSLPEAEMQRVRAGAELIWVDHHKSSLEGLQVLADAPGERSLDEAACVLTWQTFFRDKPVPDAVRYVGDRDIWRFAYPETTNFCEGLFQEDTDPSNDRLWNALLNGDPALVRALSERGAILREARLTGIARAVNAYGFVVVFEGHETLVINRRGSGDMGEHIRNLGHAIAYCYHDAKQNGDLRTFVTLYSEHVDVSEIAVKFGGGGHPGAAGFSFPRGATPFPPGSAVRAAPHL